MIGLEIICYLKDIEYKVLANGMGITPQAINSWLSGARRIPQDRLKWISEQLQVEEDIIQKNFSDQNRIDAVLKVANILKGR